MAHPTLPGQPIRVDEASVPHYQAAGWQVVGDQPPKKKAAAKGRRQPPKGDD